MKKMHRKGAAVILAAITTITGIGFRITEVSAATTFTDIAQNYWAKDDIAFAAGKGIVNGYAVGDGTYMFQPENPVSYEEATTMLYRALEAANQIEAYEASVNASGTAITLEVKHKEIMDQANIADWARKYVAYCLEYEIVEHRELAHFVDANTKLGKPAPRLTVAVWTAKALDKNVAGVVNLPFTDASLIDDDAAVYIDILYRHGIMRGSLQPDGTIAFQPNSGVKRSEFAAIANRVWSNADLEYDIEKEVFSYKTDETNSFFEGAQIRIIGNLGTNMIGTYEPGVTVSGMTFDKDETPQAHYVNAPEVKAGTIVSSTMLTKDTVKVVITVDGEDVSYLLGPQTINTAKIRPGTRVSFIADGIDLIEVE